MLFKEGPPNSLLEKLIAHLPKRDVRGRNADKILSHNLTRAAFDKDVAMEAKSFKAERCANPLP